MANSSWKINPKRNPSVSMPSKWHKPKYQNRCWPKKRRNNITLKSKRGQPASENESKINFYFRLFKRRPLPDRRSLLGHFLAMMST